jgi:threonine aldolase
MLKYMTNATVGDDVFEEDPTVSMLEKRMTEITGKERALFCVSGTMTNQLGIRTHLIQPPYSIICDRRSHVFQYEASGISYHTGAQTITLDPESGKNYITAELIQRHLILDDDVHHAPTQLICLENTLNGEIMPLDEIRYFYEYSSKKNISIGKRAQYKIAFRWCKTMECFCCHWNPNC